MIEMHERDEVFKQVWTMVHTKLEPTERQRWLATMPEWVSGLPFPEDIESDEFSVELD